MRLRPHHFMCIQFFTGHGYDERFTSHMKDVIGDLNDDSKITVTNGCDDICNHCPNMKNNTCIHEKKVSHLDRKVLENTAVCYGKELIWKDGVSLVYEHILKRDMFHKICGECEWYELCRKIREERIKDNG